MRRSNSCGFYTGVNVWIYSVSSWKKKCSDKIWHQRLFVLLHSSTSPKWAELSSVWVSISGCHRSVCSWSVLKLAPWRQSCITRRWHILHNYILQQQQTLTDISAPPALLSRLLCRAAGLVCTPPPHLHVTKQWQPLWSAHSRSHYNL